MSTFTKKADYGIVALSYMALRPGAVCNAREISERHNLPSALLMNVLKLLSQGGLVRSIRGAKGGYVLVRGADQISLAEIISAVDGPVGLVRCAAKHNGRRKPCDKMRTCPVSRPIRKVHRKLSELLSSVTLGQIAYDEDYGDPTVGRPLRRRGKTV
ncbi:MAG: Rrf2 family transcriptional regulator [Planctomycetota bacterium]